LIAATLYTLVVGLLLTAAFSTWAVGQLNMISVAFAVLYIGLGVDYAIHICLRYRELSREGFPIKESLGISLHNITPALILSTLSTSIGFYAFVPTAFTGVSELGIIAGTGMFISLLVTITLLPCLIWKLSGLREIRLPPQNAFRGPVIEKYQRPIRIATAVIAVIALILLPGISFDYDPINLRDPNSESVATVRELMADESFTPWNLNVIADDSAELQASTNQLKALPEASRVISIFSFIPKQQRAKLGIIHEMGHELNGMSSPPFVFDTLGTDEQLKAIHDFSDLLSSPAYAKVSPVNLLGQHLEQFADSLGQLDQSGQREAIKLLQSGLLKSFPYTVTGLRNSLNPRGISMEELPANLKRLWITEAGKYRIQVMPAGKIETNEDMNAFATAVQQVAPEATGDLTVTIASGDTVVKAFRQAVIYALVAITLLLLIYLRSLRETLYIMLPLMLAGVLTGAVTVVLGIQFNFANIIAVPLLLGLGVDNGVHIVHRAKTKNQHKGLLQTSTARAILFSSLTTLLSFGNLAFSPHRGTASMGWLLTIGVILVVLTTLVVLPAFLPASNPPVRD
jgi:hopanoid biosynthesis associated RND transporter like protein HpnN